MVMKMLARAALAGAVAMILTSFAIDATWAAKRNAVGPVPPGACKVSGGYIASGQACASTVNQYGMGQINWCSFGSLTPGIWCGGALCPAAKC
jgi:hypothetical protein